MQGELEDFLEVMQAASWNRSMPLYIASGIFSYWEDAGGGGRRGPGLGLVAARRGAGKEQPVQGQGAPFWLPFTGQRGARSLLGRMATPASAVPHASRL